jgi:hypothetical protein
VVALLLAEESPGVSVGGSEAAGADVAAGAGSQSGGRALFLKFGRAPLFRLGMPDDFGAGFGAAGAGCDAGGFCCWGFP